MESGKRSKKSSLTAISKVGMTSCKEVKVRTTCSIKFIKMEKKTTSKG